MSWWLKTTQVHYSYSPAVADLVIFKVDFTILIHNRGFWGVAPYFNEIPVVLQYNNNQQDSTLVNSYWNLLAPKLIIFSITLRRRALRTFILCLTIVPASVIPLLLRLSSSVAFTVVFLQHGAISRWHFSLQEHAVVSWEEATTWSDPRTTARTGYERYCFDNVTTLRRAASFLRPLNRLSRFEVS